MSEKSSSHVTIDVDKDKDVDTDKTPRPKPKPTDKDTWSGSSTVSNATLDEITDGEDTTDDDSVETVIFIDSSFKNSIAEMVRPAYERDIQHTLEWRYVWNRISSTFNVMFEVLFACNAIAAFLSASTLLSDYSVILALTAGILAVVAKACQGFSMFSKKNSQRRTKELNLLLHNANVDFVMPDITDDDIQINVSRDNNGDSSSVPTQPPSTIPLSQVRGRPYGSIVDRSFTDDASHKSFVTLDDYNKYKSKQNKRMTINDLPPGSFIRVHKKKGEDMTTALEAARRRAADEGRSFGTTYAKIGKSKHSKKRKSTKDSKSGHSKNAGSVKDSTPEIFGEVKK